MDTMERMHRELAERNAQVVELINRISTLEARINESEVSERNLRYHLEAERTYSKNYYGIIVDIANSLKVAQYDEDDNGESLWINEIKEAARHYGELKESVELLESEVSDKNQIIKSQIQEIYELKTKNTDLNNRLVPCWECEQKDEDAIAERDEIIEKSERRIMELENELGELRIMMAAREQAGRALFDVNAQLREKVLQAVELLKDC